MYYKMKQRAMLIQCKHLLNQTKKTDAILDQLIILFYSSQPAWHSKKTKTCGI
jgi:hypothetical protein